MAKTNRAILGLVCEVCGSQNYVTEKNKVNTPDKMNFLKFCKNCKKKTKHKEKPRLK